MRVPTKTHRWGLASRKGGLSGLSTDKIPPKRLHSELVELSTMSDCNTKQGYSYRTWWLNGPALSRPTSGRFLVLRQSRETFTSPSETASKCFCEHLHPSPP